MQAIALENFAPASGTPVLTDLLNEKDKSTLNKRARAKYFSFSLAKELASCNSSLKDSYFRTLTCCSKLTQTGNKITSQYCGARWCLVCNRIRTAKMINKYEPHLAQMYQPHFVTLTIPNITGDVRELKYCVQQLQKFCRRAFDRLRKQGIKFKGFRKIEISFNAEKNSYHPHIHFLVDGYTPGETQEQQLQLLYTIWQQRKFSNFKFQQLITRLEKKQISLGYIKAELLRQAWLQEFKHSRPVAQDIRPAKAGTLKELFKYSAKIITKSKSGCSIQTYEKKYLTHTGEERTVTKKKSCSAFALQIHVEALDKIYCAIFGKRILQPVGYTRAECAEFNALAAGAIDAELEAQELEGLDEEANNIFEWRGSDWYCISTGCRLTGYKPGELDLALKDSFIFDSG